MTNQKIARTNQQQNSERHQASGILQRAAVRSVSDVGVESKEDKEAQPLNNSDLSKDFSRVPISTTKPQQIMAKLMVGPVGDKYEQEADRVAQQVVQRINAPASVRSGEDEIVQREEMETKDNEARLMRSPILQRSSSDGGMAATPDLEASINRARGSGQPLANSIREPMEKEFGADFSGVKIHTDAQSDQLNRSIQASAFTTGQDVFFRQGEYNPGSWGGQELLAHELTHIVQQNGSALRRKSLPDLGIKKNKIQAEALLNSPSEYPSVIQRGAWNNLKNKFKEGGDQEVGDQIEEIEVNAENWKRYMSLESLEMKVKELIMHDASAHPSARSQFGHFLYINMTLHNKSRNRLRIRTPLPLVYFEDKITTTTNNGNLTTENESVDQYAKEPNSLTFFGYRTLMSNKTVDPDQQIKAMFFDQPQMTIKQEHKSRTVHFKIGLQGSEQWLIGVQELEYNNHHIIKHEFKSSSGTIKIID